MPATALLGFRGVLNAAISKADTLIELVLGYTLPIALPPGGYAYLTLRSGCTLEVVRVYTIVGDMLTVVRGQSGTDKRPFAKHSEIYYDKVYAEWAELLPFSIFPSLIEGGSVTIDGTNVHIPNITIIGVDYFGGVLAAEANAQGCCDLPVMLAPTPDNVTDELAIVGDAPDTNTSTSQPEYLYAYTISGGTQPYSVVVSAGTPPPGLSLSTSGVWGGRATTIGVYTFTVTVTDYWEATAEVEDTIEVTGVMFVFGAAPDGVEDEAYPAYQYGVAGGVAPYVFTVDSGVIPTGQTLNTAGVLSGTPSAAGSFTFTIEVVDGDGETAQHTDTVDITSSGPEFETRWFMTSTEPSGAASFTNAIHTHTEVGAWAANPHLVHSDCPHSLSAIGQRLIGIRKIILLSQNVYSEGFAAYSDDYGLTWERALVQAPPPRQTDLIHVTDNIAYTPGTVNSPLLFPDGATNPRETYWKTATGDEWTIIKPHRGRIYKICGGFIPFEWVNPLNIDTDLLPGGEMLTRFGRITIRVARRINGITYIGLHLQGIDPRQGNSNFPEEAPPHDGRWGGILWNAADIPGTVEDSPTAWQGGAVAPFDNIVGLGNTLITAVNISWTAAETMLPQYTLGFSTDGGLTFSPAIFSSSPPSRVEPRTLVVMDGAAYVLGHTTGVSTTYRLRWYKSVDGETWIPHSTLTSSNADPSGRYTFAYAADLAYSADKNGATYNLAPGGALTQEAVRVGRYNDTLLELVRVRVPIP